MRRLFVDLETYSDTDLISCGLAAYVADPSFRVLLFGCAWDDEPPQLFDLEHGQTLPDDVRQALFDPDVVKYAHNAAFEISCLYPGIDLAPIFPQWRCTQAWAQSLALPAPLQDLAIALGLSVTKDRAGKALIQRFSVKAGREKYGDPAAGDPDWLAYGAYCLQDVVVERAIALELAK